MATKILIADSQPLTAAGITHFLSETSDLTIVGHVAVRNSLGALLRDHQPDLLIVDYNIPGYVNKSDLHTVREHSPKTHILVISSDTDTSSILEVLKSGVIGYLKKDSSREEIMMAVYAAAKGEKFFSHEILNIIMEERFKVDTVVSPPGSLTARETEMLTLLASGYSTQRIADEFHLSPHTVHTHRKSIIKKLNIKSPTEFVIYALDFGLIKPK